MKDTISKANVGIDEELLQVEMVKKFVLGSDTVKFKFHESTKSKIFYISLHDDENTAVGAIESQLDCNFNGRFVELNHSGERLVKFKLGGENYIFDPNRIFTPTGVKASLEKYSKYNADAAKIVESFGAFIVDSLLKEAEMVVAIHNNGNNGYSILDYKKGGVYQADAADVFINEDADVDNFLYVTEKHFFDVFKNNNFNVILQNNSKVTDDGSLSVYCGLNNKKYINIEAQDGELVTNIEMIKFTNKILSDSIATN
jgi:hypothetical protein